MPSYPCGVCTVGVRYKGIFCNGTCKKCTMQTVNIASKELKDLSKKDSTNWIYRRCTNTQLCEPRTLAQLEINTPNSSFQEPELSIIEPNPENTEVSFSKSPDCLYTSIKELENSLNENNFLDNLENNYEKLKIGAALLEENNLLRGKNIELEAKLEILEEQLDRMKIEENKYLSKIEDLLQNLSETQVQLGKEKKLRLDTKIIFEEHD
ncbi:hypothetical protein J6590_032675 [Homalodisca vitripennis]|nr:hypothetical protein J6590_032675 [Homalodisca vitripennis]